MIITHKIMVRLDSREEQQTIDTVQGDTGRSVEISLLDNGSAWSVPDGTRAMVRYRRVPGGGGGAYDVMPDGTDAYVIDGNKVTIRLAPQVLSVAGMSQLQVTLMKDQTELTCFTILLRVQGNLSEATMEEADYINLSGYIRSEVEMAVGELDHVVVKETGAQYYSSLSQAVADVNADSTAGAMSDGFGASVKVFTAQNGRLTIMLLGDVTVEQVVTISRNADLVLGGHKITLTESGRIDFAEGVYCEVIGGTDPITGARGAIVKEKLPAAVTAVIQCYAQSFICKDVDVFLTGQSTSSVYGIYARNGCARVEMENCSIRVENTSQKSGVAYGYRVQDSKTETVLRGCSITACSAANMGFGIYNIGALTTVQTSVDAETGSGEYTAALMDVGTNAKTITGGTWTARSVSSGHAYAFFSNVATTFKFYEVYAEARAISQGNAFALRMTNGVVVEAERCDFKAVAAANNDNQSAYGAYNEGAVLYARNCRFYADAQGGNSPEDMAVGVMNNGRAYLDDCTVTGTHSGCENFKDLYVRGGIYTGTTHGGFYFAHGSEGIGYVTDAYIRDGHYDGEFKEFWDAQQWVYWGGFYVGGGSEAYCSNMTVYLDGCTMEGVKHGFTMRGSSGEKNNTVNLSNCAIVGGASKPINFHNNTHRVNVGVGCDITTDMIYVPEGVQVTPGLMVFTGELYRRLSDDRSLNGRDLQLLTAAVGQGTEAAPDYVRAEAERVAALVQSRQNANTVTMMLGADIHARLGDQRSAQMLESARHAAQAMQIIRDRVHIDLAGLLGDYLWDNGETAAEAMEMYRIIGEYFAPAFRGLPQFWCKGNHDMLGNSASGTVLTDAQTFSAIGIRNSGNVFHGENRVHGYCYRDFDDLKLRVVCMNTGETVASHAVGTAQNAWLTEVLSLSGKSGWKSVILCHVPLDSWGAESTVLKNVANYEDKILCVIHGHLHNFLTGTLEGTAIPRICIPNIDFYRTNEYGKNSTGEGSGGYIEYGQAVSYEKTAGTAEDTSFCVVTIDLETGKLYADHYGAGYDRVVELGAVGSAGGGTENNGNAGTYTNQIPRSTAAIGSSEIYNGVGYKAGARLNSGFIEVTAGGMCCTGYIPVKVGDVIRIKNVTIYGNNDAYGCVYTAAGGGAVSYSGAEMTAATVNGVTTLTVTGQTAGQLYFRLSVGVIDDTSIITVNESIG